jgi:hypothetical protein
MTVLAKSILVLALVALGPLALAAAAFLPLFDLSPLRTWR